MKSRFCAALLTAALLVSQIPTAAAAGQFPDVPSTHWANAYIERVTRQGWMNGVGSGFAPDRTLSGAEVFALMGNILFSDELQNQPKAESSEWYTQSYSLAKSLELDKGTAFTSEQALTNPVSRYDMAQILANALNAKEIPVQTDVQEPAFDDWSSCPEQYRAAIAACVDYGILSGKNGSFAGTDNLTRAEAASLLCRVGDRFPDEVSAAPSAPQSALSETEKMLQMMNEERAKEGLSALVLDETLSTAAKTRAEETCHLFSHTRTNGTEFFTVLPEADQKDRSLIGENLRFGLASAEAMIESMMGSPYHRANILNPTYTHVGIAVVNTHWVQLFVTRTE